MGIRNPKGHGSLQAFTVCQGARGSPTKGSIDLNADLNGLREYQRYSRVSTHQSRPMLGMPCWSVSVSKDSIGIWYDREARCLETLLLSVTAPIVVAMPGAWGHAHGARVRCFVRSLLHARRLSARRLHAHRLHAWRQYLHTRAETG